MKRVELHHTKDLDYLRNLSGDEYIFVKIFKTFSPASFRAVSLKKFSGTIDVDVEQSNYSPCTVLVDEGMSRRFIFTNIEKAEILLPRQQTFSIHYREISNNFYISTVHDFAKVQKNVDHQKCIVLHFFDDVVLESFPKDFLKNYTGKIRIVGDGHQLFLKNTTTWNEFLASHRVYVENFKIILIDQIVFVKTAQDLEKLRYLEHGRVVVNICNDIDNFQLDSISLEKFVGTLFILGHRKILHDFCIRGFQQTHGFISTIHPAANLKVYNLSLQNVISEHYGDCESAGIFLGERGFVPSEVRNHFMPGQIFFFHCSVRNAMLPVTSKNGTFVGNGDDEMDMWDCFDENVFDQDGNQIRSFLGSTEGSYLSSFYSNFKSELDDVREQTRMYRERCLELKRKND